MAPGVVLNKDGSFQRSFRFRGPDLESATEAELVAACARLNNVLRRFGSGWALFFEAERFRRRVIRISDFPDAASWLVDEERRAAFESGGVVADAGKRATRPHFESGLLPDTSIHAAGGPRRRAERALIETPEDKSKRDWRHELAAFVAETDRALDLLARYCPRSRRSMMPRR